MENFTVRFCVKEKLTEYYYQMKTTKVLAAAGALAVLLGAAACTEKTTSCKNCDKAISFITVKQEKAYTLEGSAKEYGADADLSFYCEASFLMPESLNGFDTQILKDEILKTAFDTTTTECTRKLIDGSLGSIAASVGDGHYTLAADSSATLGTADGAYTVSGTVASMTPSVLSYCIRTSSYEPRAAHGMTKDSYVNYDLKDGKIITIGDVVTADGLDKLPEVLKTIAYSMRNYIGPTELTALPTDGNFYMNLDGDLVFVYQPYEIASYAQGIIEIPVPAYLISDLLTPYGKTLFDL